MAERYTAKCRVCGKVNPIGPGWCKLILYDDEWNKTTEWLCPFHYKEFEDGGKKVIPGPDGEEQFPPKCPDHPRYTGKRKPRAVDCKECNRIWSARKRGVEVSSPGSGS